MRLFAICIMTGVLMAVTGPCFSAGNTAAGRLESSYIESIHEDARILLEGIELFIQRDYPRYWSDFQNLSPIKKEMVKKYLDEMGYFGGLLDSLYKEYTSYQSGAAYQNLKAGSKPEISKLEDQILQMLAYSFIRTGDFAMAEALTKKGAAIKSNHVIRIRNLEGKLQPFPLTDNLNKLFDIINSNLTTLQVDLKYFFPSDVNTLNAYLRISDYNPDNPFNTAFLAYYSNIFPDIGSNKENLIHFGEIIRFLNRLKYNNLIKKPAPGSSQDQVTLSCEFPMLTGEYEILNFDDDYFLYTSGDTMALTVERLCFYKGFLRTDFRDLKGEEKQNVQKDTIIDKGFTLQAIETVQGTGKKLKNPAHPGDRLRYGPYRLYENSIYIGRIMLVPCYQGDDCKRATMNKNMTEVKVYDHELVLTRDILDLVKSKEKAYGYMPVEPDQSTSPAKPNTGSRVGLFRGCSARPDTK